MKITYKSDLPEREVIAYQDTISGALYLRASDDKIISISPSDHHSKSSAMEFSSLGDNPDYFKPLYEGDVVEITL